MFVLGGKVWGREGGKGCFLLVLGGRKGEMSWVWEARGGKEWIEGPEFTYDVCDWSCGVGARGRGLRR